MVEWRPQKSQRSGVDDRQDHILLKENMNKLLADILNLDLWGIGLLIVRFFDGFKYHIESCSLRKVNVARGRSRRFINYAWGADAYMIFYLFAHKIDWYMVISFILALIFMTEYWWILYIKYPYKGRGLLNFRRPNIFLYFINSIIPNKLRKRL